MIETRPNVEVGGASGGAPERGLHEECGVVGIWLPKGGDGVAQTTHNALQTLQHRGQDGAGIMVSNGEGTFGYRGHGLVREAFTHEAHFIDHAMPDAFMAVGQDRYGTSPGAAADSFDALQPQRGKSTPIALGHNGQVTNMPQVANSFSVEVEPHHSDTQMMTATFDRIHADGRSLVDTTRLVGSQMDGAFSLVIMDEAGKQLVAARDPWGMRPLMLGMFPDGGYMVASETVALDVAGAVPVREIEPGEVLSISDKGLVSSKIPRGAQRAGCYFEYTYFMDPKSRVFTELPGMMPLAEGPVGPRGLVPVGELRREVGRVLAAEHPPLTPPENTIVVGIPASGMLGAEGYAEATGLPLVPAARKREGAQRSFIEPTQEGREKAADGKLIINEALVEGKDVIVVDDSIVRGTTFFATIKKFIKAGANSIHIRILSPAYRDTCTYGVNTGVLEELIAYGRTDEDIRKLFDTDPDVRVASLGYVSPEGVEKAINIGVGNLCMRCATSEDKIAATPRPSLGSVMLGLPAVRRAV